MSEPSFPSFAEVATTSTEQPRTAGEPTEPTDIETGDSAGGPPGGEPGVPAPPLGGGGALPHKKRWSFETAFRGLTSGAGLLVLAIIVAIGVFLITKAIPALNANHANFLTFKNWFTSDNPPRFGIAALAFGTVVTSFIALLIAVPIAVSIALCLTHYAPPR